MSREFTSLELAYMQLQRNGKTQDEARAILFADPSLAETLAPHMRAEMERRFEAERQAAFDASPAGRKLAAERAEKEKAEREQLVGQARTLLGQSHGDVSDLSDDEVLHYSGIEPDEKLMTGDEREQRPDAASAEDREPLWAPVAGGDES